ncbi:hypothetical protein D3C75_941370 [compost metagenome]
MIFEYPAGSHPITVELRKILDEAVNGMEKHEALSAIEERLKSTKDRRTYERLQTIRLAINGNVYKLNRYDYVSF